MAAHSFRKGGGRLRPRPLSDWVVELFCVPLGIWRFVKLHLKCEFLKFTKYCQLENFTICRLVQTINHAPLLKKIGKNFSHELPNRSINRNWRPCPHLKATHKCSRWGLNSIPPLSGRKSLATTWIVIEFQPVYLDFDYLIKMWLFYFDVDYFTRI